MGPYAKNWGAKTVYFGAVTLNSTKCEMPNKRSYPSYVNTRYDYGGSGIRWHRIVNVNETMEIKSLVSRGPKKL